MNPNPSQLTRNVFFIAILLFTFRRLSSYPTLPKEQRAGDTLDSRVETLYSEIIHFIEKQVDSEKLDRVKRWYREPVASYGFDKADMEQVHNRFDDHFNALRLEEGIELAGKVIRSGNNALIHLGNSSPQSTEGRAWAPSFLGY